jgi:hypothetical protein
MKDYEKIVDPECGLPPRRPGRYLSLRRRLACSLHGHQYERWFVHAGDETVFHWYFHECGICGKTTVMYPEFCKCRERGRVDPRRSPHDQSDAVRVSPAWEVPGGMDWRYHDVPRAQLAPPAMYGPWDDGNSKNKRETR